MHKRIGRFTIPIALLLALLAGVVAFGMSKAQAATVAAAAGGSSDILAQVQTSQKLTVGWAEWNPFEYRDVTTNSLKGMLVDMATLVAGKLGAKPDFVEDSWATLASGVATGKFDIALEGITAERTKVVDFSHPIYQTVFTAIVKQDGAYKSWDDLNKPGVAISVTTGSNTDQLLTQLSKEGKVQAKIVRIKDVGAGVLALASGEVQAYTDQKDSLLSVAASHPEYRVVNGSYGAAQFGIAVPKGNTQFKAAIDRAVVSLLKEGSVKHLLDQYHVAGNEPATVR